jgi:hypothetical protein
MKKTYWGVQSEFSTGGSFADARLLARFRAVKPREEKRSRTNGVVFRDWFETKEEAVSYLNDVGGMKELTRGRKA